MHIFWARLARFCHLGSINDSLIVLKSHNETHDTKGQENQIYTIVKGRETFYCRHTVPVTSCSEVKYVLRRVSFGSKDCTKELKLECAYFLDQNLLNVCSHLKMCTNYFMHISRILFDFWEILNLSIFMPIWFLVCVICNSKNFHFLIFKHCIYNDCSYIEFVPLLFCANCLRLLNLDIIFHPKYSGYLVCVMCNSSSFNSSYSYFVL